MDTSRRTVVEIITDFCDELRRQGIRVEQSMLFGSHARGVADEDSDVDLLIVSPDFAPMDRLSRLRLLSRARLTIGHPIHAYPATPEEIATVEPATFLEEILEKAVPIAVPVAGPS